METPQAQIVDVNADLIEPVDHLRPWSISNVTNVSNVNHKNTTELLLYDGKYRKLHFLSSYAFLVVSPILHIAIMSRVYDFFHLICPRRMTPSGPEYVTNEFTFPGPMPQSLDANTLQNLDVNNCITTYKTAGTRCYLILQKFDGKPHAFLMNRRLKILLIPGLRSSILQHPKTALLNDKEDASALFDGTLFDGDIVRNFDGTYSYVPHDMIWCAGNDLTQVRYDERLKLLSDLFEHEMLVTKDTAPFKLFYKSMYNFTCVRQVFDIVRQEAKEVQPNVCLESSSPTEEDALKATRTMFALSLPFPCDPSGVVISEKDAIVETGTSQTIRKCKLGRYNTTELRATVRSIGPPNTVPRSEDLVIDLRMSGNVGRSIKELHVLQTQMC